MPTPLSSACHSVVRRSPRIGNHNSSLEHPPPNESSSQRFPALSSSPDDTTGDGTQASALQRSIREHPLGTARRIQFHPSLEAVSAPTSVDDGALRITSTGNSCSNERQQGLSESGRSSEVEPRLAPTTPSASKNDVVDNGDDVCDAQGEVCPIPNTDGSERGAFLVRQTSADGETRPSEANELTCAFNFLSYLSVKDLRQVLRDWGLKQSANKSTLIARTLLDVQKAVLGGKTVQQGMSSHLITRRYENWVKQQVTLDLRSPRHWRLAPSESELFDKLEVRETAIYTREKTNLLRARDGLPPTDDQRPPMASTVTANGRVVGNSGAQMNAGNASLSTVFSISEFDRLCIVMRDDEDAKAAFEGIGQELNRSQLDAGICLIPHDVEAPRQNTPF